jgi:hypothetical protein
LPAPCRSSELIEPPQARGVTIREARLASALRVARFAEPQASAGREAIAQTAQLASPALDLVELRGGEQLIGSRV